MPFLGLKNIQSSGIRRCRGGCENLSLPGGNGHVCGCADTNVGACDRCWCVDMEELGSVHAHGGDCAGGHLLAGLIRIYVSSRQLGIKWRVIGILCSWIPVVHLIVLGKLISLASGETVLENREDYKG